MKRAILLLAGLLAASNALAAPAKGVWYAGLGVGAAENTLDRYGDSGAWHLLGGYQMQERLAFEIDYLNLGEYKNNAALIDGLAFGVLGIAALSQRVSLQGRLGLLSWSHNHRYPPKSISTGTAPLYGLNLAVQVEPKVQVRIGWQKFLGVADAYITLITGDVIYFFK